MGNKTVWRCYQCQRLFSTYVPVNRYVIGEPVAAVHTSDDTKYHPIALCDDCVKAVIQPKG